MEDVRLYSVEIPNLGAFLLIDDGADVGVISGGVEAIEYLIGELDRPAIRMRRLGDVPGVQWLRYDQSTTTLPQQQGMDLYHRYRRPDKRDE